MRLTQADLRSLEGDFRSPGKLLSWETTADNGHVLRRESGFCTHLDSRRRCGIYEQRPEQCRAYPYLWTAYSRSTLDVDLSCPGLGRGESISLPARPSDDEIHPAQRREAIRRVQELLRAQKRYAAPETLNLLGKRYLKELAAVWPGKGLRMSPSWRPQTNLETAADLSTGAGWLEPILQLRLNRARMERHFSRPGWNTRLGPEAQVTIYRFWVAGGVLHIEPGRGVSQALQLLDQAQFAWHPLALAARGAYLELWLERDLPLRLASNMAVAGLLRGDHVATCYLDFFADVDWRLSVLALMLASARGKKEVDQAIVLEAIRGSDNLLRAWCESARLGSTD